ncbi:MAG: alpha/beta hydrolase [Syntrophomonadaceae bacterium]|nr:alpha/beta hydrolase [Syntrophomonadaceae bacterium]
MPVCDLISHQLYYESRKAKKPRGTVVFVHGSGGTSQTWREQMPFFSDDWNCAAIDLPGHGRSSPPLCPSTTEAARLLKAFINQESFLAPIYLAGHSLGAAIVLEYALNYPGDPGGIIIIGGGAKLKVLPQILTDLSHNEIHKDLIKMSFSPKSDPHLIDSQAELFMQNSSAVLYADFNACNEFDLTENLSGITSPALMITGDEDVLTPPKYADYLQNHLSDSRLVIVESAGHFVMLEQPDSVNAVIKDFLNAL